MTSTNRRLLIAANRPVNLLRKFTFDRTAGTANISTCSALIKSMRGNTIVWNQISIDYKAESVMSAGWDVTTSITDGVLTISSTSYGGSNGSQARLTAGNISITEGHKILLRGATSAINLRLQGDSTSNLDTGSGIIITSQSGCKTDIVGKINFENGSSINETLIPQIFDLTLMFGAGNEPSTAAEFEALFPLDYYAYNEGELLSFNGTSIKTTGFNQWDEQWTNDMFIYANNQETSVSGRRVSTNYIKVIPATTYCFSGADMIVLQYDANKQMASDDQSLFYKNVTNGATLTLLNNTHYIKIEQMNQTSADICVNISDASKNGTYEPYQQPQTKDISYYKSITYNGSTLFPYGLLSAGDVYDEVTATKAIKRVGVVDLGSLDWVYETNFAYPRFRSNIKIMEETQSNKNLVCSIYTPDRSPILNSDVDYTMCGYNGYVYLHNFSYTDAATFKTAMNGVMLYYELVEPVEVDFTEQNLEYPAYRTGTEELLPANGDVPTTTSALLDIRYKIGGRRN